MKNRVLIHGDTATIWLRHKGAEYPCLVDADDAQMLSDVCSCWHLQMPAKKHSGYPSGSIYRDGVRYSVKMHRVVMKASAGQLIDHVSGDTLDNRRKNLRFASTHENALNRTRLGVRNKTGVRGVFERRGKFSASVTSGGIRHWCGAFYTLPAAAKAVRAKLLSLGVPFDNAMRLTDYTKGAA